jgi:hypothetical protein
MCRVFPPLIIRSANNCIYSIWYLNNILIYIQKDGNLHSLFYLETALHVSGVSTTHHQKHKQLNLQYLVYVTPLLLSAAIVKQLELFWVCCGWYFAFYPYLQKRLHFSIENYYCFNPLNPQLNPIYHLLALLEPRQIFHVNGLRVIILVSSAVEFTTPCTVFIMFSICKIYISM